MSIETEKSIAPSANTTNRTRAQFGKRIISTVARWVLQALLRRAMHRAERQLRSLDDRMLQDLGLKRSDISAALVSARAVHAGSDPHSIEVSSAVPQSSSGEKA